MKAESSDELINGVTDLFGLLCIIKSILGVIEKFGALHGQAFIYL